MRLQDFVPEKKSEESSDLKRLVHLIVLQWKWFSFFAILGLIVAFVYSETQVQQYSVSNTILIPEKENSLILKDLFSGGLVEPSNNNIFNQIGIISSYYTIRNTLSNLNWRTGIFTKDFLRWRSMYNNEPFIIEEPKDFMNPKGIRIQITPKIDDSYTIMIKGELKNTGVSIDIEQEGEFGFPFVNGHFNFTLLKKDPNRELSGQFYFVFYDLNDLTLKYYTSLRTIHKDKKSDIIQCSVEGENPKKESDFINHLIQFYINNKIENQNQAQFRTLEFINSQLSGISDSLNSAGNKVEEYRSKNNIINLSTEGTLIMNNLKELETQKGQSQMQLEYYRGLLSYLSEKKDLKNIVSPSVVGIQDASLNALVTKLMELYSRREVVSFSAKENNISLLMIDKEISQIRRQLSENLQNLVENSTKIINLLQTRITSINSDLNTLPQKEQKMINIQRQFNLTSEIYTFLLQKRAEANIAMASRIPDVEIIDVARPETAVPVGSSKRIILILGTLLGVAIPIGFIELLNFMNVKIKSQEDIEKNTTIPIIGNICHDNTHSYCVVYNVPDSIISENFRSLRTNLQFLMNDSIGKIISVHSFHPNEGKTFVSINLASILSMNNKRVMLIGADLRKPKLHRIFDILNDHGLSTLLSGIDSFDQIIFKTPLENLWVIPSGPIPPNPVELLEKQEMKNLLKKLALSFDYIIIDNSPMSMLTDSNIVSHLSDANLFILRFGVSNKTSVDLIDRISSRKIMNHLYIAVNDIRERKFGYTYYKYYNESYKEYKHKKKKKRFLEKMHGIEEKLLE